MTVSEVFKALSDESRVRILNLLQKGDRCVCEIETILDLSQTNASRHLAKLRSAGIVDQKKEGQWVYYRISEDFRNENRNLLDSLFETFQSDPECVQDLLKLNKYQDCGFNCEAIRAHKKDVMSKIGY